MKIINISKNQFSQLENCVNLAKKSIENYSDDKAQLRSDLCKIIDIMPNVAFLDVDVLENYGIEAEDSQWVESDADELEFSHDMLKSIINESDFETYQLSLRGSGSILFTIFGDAYFFFL